VAASDPERARHAAADPARPGDLLVRVGAAVFLVGVVAVVAAVVPSVVTGHPGRLPLLVLALTLLPLGLGVALLGLLRSARTGRRAGRALPARRAP